MTITRIRITIIRNTITFLQIDIKGVILIAIDIYKSNNINSSVKHKTGKPADNFNSNNDSDNNNFSNRGNNNNNNNNPLDNENHVRHVSNTRHTVFILGDSIVKNLNGYLLTKIAKQKS